MLMIGFKVKKEAKIRKQYNQVPDGCRLLSLEMAGLLIISRAAGALGPQ